MPTHSEVDGGHQHLIRCVQVLRGPTCALLRSELLDEKHVTRFLVQLEEASPQAHADTLMREGVPEDAKTNVAFSIVAVFVQRQWDWLAVVATTLSRAKHLYVGQGCLVHGLPFGRGGNTPFRSANPSLGRMILTIQEGQKEEQSTDTVPRWLSQDAILINLLQDRSDNTVQLLESALAVDVAARLSFANSDEADRRKRLTAAFVHVKLTSLVYAVGDTPSIQCMTEDGSFGPHSGCARDGL